MATPIWTTRSKGVMTMLLEPSRLLGFLLIVCLLVTNQASQATEVLRPRGVPLSKTSFYDPERLFSCLDGSAEVPFHFVNDDYCDCLDGSDEPGTAACPNGVFHCTNAGHMSMDIPSSRVNDGICDCCDASDEYNSSAQCMKNCLELGRQAREEARQQQELVMKGFKLREEMSKEGKQKKADSKAKLERIKQEKEEAQRIKDIKEAIKKEVEEREKEALEKYKEEEDSQKQQQEELEMLQHQQHERRNAEEAFSDLDKNHDGILTVNEIQEFPKFDQNRDGAVSEEEAKFFLHMKDEMELDEFVSTGWMIMKPIYMMDKITTPEPPVLPVMEDTPEQATEMPLEESMEDEGADKEDEELKGEGSVASEDIEEDESEDEEDEDDSDIPPEFPPKSDLPDEQTKTTAISQDKYDPETRRIVEEAKQARDDFTRADHELNKIQDEIRDLEQLLESDYGPDDEFIPLRGQCLELTDREYTYKLCPFDSASQRPKSGGVETSLGRWGHWAGSDDNKYRQMKMDAGTGCWNGPARSVLINVVCGLENKLLSASEPNRCEYLFGFSTPAACTTIETHTPDSQEHIHEEL